jgi:hypothetical protein
MDFDSTLVYVVDVEGKPIGSANRRNCPSHTIPSHPLEVQRAPRSVFGADLTAPVTQDESRKWFLKRNGPAIDEFLKLEPRQTDSALFGAGQGVR